MIATLASTTRSLTGSPRHPPHEVPSAPQLRSETTCRRGQSASARAFVRSSRAPPGRARSSSVGGGRRSILASFMRTMMHPQMAVPADLPRRIPSALREFRCRRSAVEIVENASQLYYFERAVQPVIFPADHNVTTSRIMAVIAEIAAAVLELDPHALPTVAVPIDAPLRFAVGKRSVNRLNEESQFVADHAEEIHDRLLVDWGVSKPTKADRRPVLHAARSVPLCGVCAADGRRWWRRRRHGVL
jgi:hypothetical protein